MAFKKPKKYRKYKQYNCIKYFSTKHGFNYKKGNFVKRHGIMNCKGKNRLDYYFKKNHGPDLFEFNFIVLDSSGKIHIHSVITNKNIKIFHGSFDNEVFNGAILTDEDYFHLTLEYDIHDILSPTNIKKVREILKKKTEGQYFLTLY